MIKIIFDTNFAIIPFQFNVDVYSELNRIIDEKYEIFFPKICLAELEKLKNGKTAVELMKNKKVMFLEIPAEKSVDKSILFFAKKENVIIATQDAGLKKKALKEKVDVITLRQKKILTIIKSRN